MAQDEIVRKAGDSRAVMLQRLRRTLHQVYNRGRLGMPVKQRRQLMRRQTSGWEEIKKIEENQD